MRTHVITCPSGLRGEVRPIGLHHRSWRDIVERCWRRTIDPGPYSSDPLRWDDVLASDYTSVLYEIIVFTYGGDASRSSECSSCGARAAVMLKDFPLYAVTSAWQQARDAGNRFTVDLMDAGTSVVVRLPTWRDVRYLDRVPPLLIWDTMFRRLIVATGDGRSVDDLVEDLSIDDTYDLKSALEGTFVGAEFTQDVSCPRCSTNVSVSMLG
jgi:hypothetical protein